MPPGLRPIKDPSIVIPTDQRYPNQPPNLPTYKNISGKLAIGWVSKYVEIRRFSSDQSALIYYRVSDLARSHVLKASKVSRGLHIWPVGTIIVLESYKGDVDSPKHSKLLEIVLMKKMNSLKGFPVDSFFSMNWSYARFSPEGKPSITSQKVRECHQCHSIAFHLLGDLVFTQFP